MCVTQSPLCMESAQFNRNRQSKFSLRSLSQLRSLWSDFHCFSKLPSLIFLASRLNARTIRYSQPFHKMTNIIFVLCTLNLDLKS